MHFRLVSDLADDTKIYRYMSLESFISMMESEKILFTKISEWDDPWEAFGSKLPLFNEGKPVERLYSACEELFCQCWTLLAESDAMWRIYSTQKTGIQISTSLRKFRLLKNAKACVISKIVYGSSEYDLLIKSEAIKMPFADALVKRDAFAHEQEVRVMVYGPDVTDYNHEWSHIQLPLDIANFIEGIKIDPRAEEWYVNTIREYCVRRGLNTEPSKSTLYDPNPHKRSKFARNIVAVNE